MEFSKSDQIKFFNNKVIHQSAGGFVFFESPKNHILYVALLQKSDGKFFIPKGHIKKNEKPKAAAIREIKEELQLKITPEIITKIDIDNYTFTLPDDNRIHYKNVHLYVFNMSQKESIQSLREDGFISAEWLKFSDAVEKIAFDRKNLLKARQQFYLRKPVKALSSIED